MFIKRIELINFQKHERFEADFTAGTNVLYGETDRGKSCILRAIKWLAFGEPKGDVVRKEGTELTMVSIFLNSGVKITRIKSASLNAYEIEKDGKTKRLDGIGKTVPAEVEQLLGMFPMKVDEENILLNISSQMAPPFLLEDAGSFRMKVFNKLTGNDVIDKVFQSFSKDVFNLKREKASKSEELEARMVKQAILQGEYDSINGLYCRASARFKGLAERAGHMAHLQKEVASRANVERALTDIMANMAQINIPEPEKVALLGRRSRALAALSSFVASRSVAKEQLSDIESKIGSLRFPDSIDSLRPRAAALKQLAQLREERVGQAEKIIDLNAGIAKAEEGLEKDMAAYKDMLRQAKTCPICRRDITEYVSETIIKAKFEEAV